MGLTPIQQRLLAAPGIQRPVPFRRLPPKADVDPDLFTIHALIASTATGGMIV